MLKYEEKLHFDAHYRALQKMGGALRHGGWYRAGALAAAAVCYTPLYFAAKYLLVLLSDQPLWQHAALLLWVGPVPFTVADAVYFCVGLLLFCWGGARFGGAGSPRPGKEQPAGGPKTLLTSGPYAKTRHPMYGAFILLQGGFLLSLCTRSGLLLALLVAALQYFNAIWEERHTLAPQFGASYEAYRAQVPHLLFRPWQAALLLLAALFSIAGFAV